MPIYGWSCAACGWSTESYRPIADYRLPLSCTNVQHGTAQKILYTPHVQQDWKPYVDYASPDGKFPTLSGGKAEYRELVKKRADQGIYPKPGR